MAAPTLSACTPGTIFTGGQLVTLTGTGFRTAYPVSAEGIVPTPPPTVSVTFGGVAAVEVCVFSATELTCIAPAHDPGAAVIVAKNLDVNGAPIAGEQASVSGLVSYSRIDLSIEDDFTRATRALITLLRQQVIQNVVETTSVDYSDDMTLQVVNIASLPCLTVGSPTTKADNFYADIIPERATSSNTFEQRRWMKTISLTWKIQGFDNSVVRCLNLQALTEKVLSSNRWLYLDRDSADLSLGQVRYELTAGDFGASGTANTSDVRSFSGEVTLRGWTMEDFAGLPSAMLSRKGSTADTILIGIGTDVNEV